MTMTMMMIGTLLDMTIDREALQILPQRRFDNSSSSAVVGTFGVTSNSLLSGTTSSSSWTCCCSAASTFACKLLVLATLWQVSVYTLCRGAANISSVVDVPAVFTTNVNLVYIMSWVFLQRQFVSIRVYSLFTVRLYTLTCCHLPFGENSIVLQINSCINCFVAKQEELFAVQRDKTSYS